MSLNFVTIFYLSSEITKHKIFDSKLPTKWYKMTKLLHISSSICSNFFNFSNFRGDAQACPLNTRSFFFCWSWTLTRSSMPSEVFFVFCFEYFDSGFSKLSSSSDCFLFLGVAVGVLNRALPWGLFTSLGVSGNNCTQTVCFF